MVVSFFLLGGGHEIVPQTQIGVQEAGKKGLLNHQGIEEIFGSAICGWSNRWRISCDGTVFLMFVSIFTCF